MSNRQLAVVEGLVQDRCHQIVRGAGILHSRRAPVSYGVICDREYNPKFHSGDTYRIDPLDGKKWATNQIQWLIVQVYL